MAVVREEDGSLIKAGSDDVAMPIGREPLADASITLVLAVAAAGNDILIGAAPSAVESHNIDPGDHVALRVFPTIGRRDVSPVDCHPLHATKIALGITVTVHLYASLLRRDFRRLEFKD